MSEAATQSGVVTRRTEQFSEILKNREAQIDAELKEGGTTEGIAVLQRDKVVEGDPLKPADIPDEDWGAMSDEQKNLAIADAKKAAEPVAEPEVQAEPAKPEAQDTAKAKVKIKVDGQEKEVDQDEVMQAGIRTLQKESAADKRLEDATKAKEEAERLRSAAEKAVAQPSEPAKSPKDMLLEKDAMRGIVKAIQYGSEDEAATALLEYGQKMAQLGQASALTLDEVNDMLNLRSAQQYVRENYADVMGDTNLKQLFVTNVNSKLAAGDARPYQEICKDVGDELRTWRGAPQKQEATPKTGASRAEVKERKTSIVTVPSAAARQPAPSQQRAQSPTDTVALMRANREKQAGRA